MSPRRHCLLFASVAIATLLGVGGVNRWLDHRRDQDDYVLEEKIAQALNVNQPVVFPGGLHEGMLRWRTVQGAPRAPDMVVLGSSHGLSITSQMLAVEFSMNLSVSGASLLEHLTSGAQLEQRGYRATHQLIFVDPWLFDRGADSGAWRAQAEALFAFQEKLSAQASPALEPIVTPDSLKKTVSGWQRVSFEPVAHVIDQWGKRLFLSVDHAPANPINATVIAIDGAFVASHERKPPAPAAVEALARRQFSGNPDRHRYGNYATVDELLWSYFERWIARGLEHGRITLILSPYHPSIHASIAQSAHNQTIAVERRVREFAAARHIAVLGSYDPAVAGVTAEDFSDGDHLTSEGLAKLLRPLQPTDAPRP